jgi:hypothetical protein
LGIDEVHKLAEAIKASESPWKLLSEMGEKQELLEKKEIQAAITQRIDYGTSNVDVAHVLVSIPTLATSKVILDALFEALWDCYDDEEVIQVFIEQASDEILLGEMREQIIERLKYVWDPIHLYGLISKRDVYKRDDEIIAGILQNTDGLYNAFGETDFLSEQLKLITDIPELLLSDGVIGTLVSIIENAYYPEYDIKDILDVPSTDEKRRDRVRNTH